MTENLAIFRPEGLGARLFRAADDYAKQYVFSPDEGCDHEPNAFEKMLFEDMLNGLFADEAFAAILQEAALGMKAGGADPEGPDDPRYAPATLPAATGHPLTAK